MSIVISNAVSESASHDERLHMTKRRQVNVRGIREPVAVSDVELNLEAQDGTWAAMFGQVYDDPRLPKREA